MRRASVNQEVADGRNNGDSQLGVPSPRENSSQRSYLSRLSLFTTGFRSVLRGQISARKAALELFRRGGVWLKLRSERTMLDELESQPARLVARFEQLSPEALLQQFRKRSRPSFFPGFETAQEATASLQHTLFPVETKQLLESARLIKREHRWPLLGFGEKNFGERINWHRDPLSGRVWPLEFHADISLWHGDGSDIRVLWELNRLGHFITLGRAYAISGDEGFAEEFLSQLDDWRDQNPVGRGANWACAMEAALRAMNLLAAFSLVHGSAQLTEDRLLMVLSIFDQHGAYIRRNLEFSHIATSNHYLSDVVGLLWLGIMLPELRRAKEWSQWALQEMLKEMDKQVLPDGADYESSTGYHRFVLELLVYSFALCKVNGIDIKQEYWQKLRLMFDYLRAYLRPDGFAPLIGDTDGGQVMPIRRRQANDHAYLLALGAAIFHEPNFKLPSSRPPEELLWVLGEDGIREYEDLASGQKVLSQAYREAGTYVLRNDDLFLLFNTSGAGGNGRASHGHNDALSLEISICDRAFIVDPGSYVYTADLHERQLFRSTAYHSTIQIDNQEQNSTYERVPFVIGDEANPQVSRWETGPEHDLVVAEHGGYHRLSLPVRHRRSVTFHKRERWWLVEDELIGTGAHHVAARFHFAPALEISVESEGIAVACDKISSAKLFVYALDLPQRPQLEPRFSSNHYGAKRESIAACWSIKTDFPCRLRWAIVALCQGNAETEGWQLIRRLREGYP